MPDMPRFTLADAEGNFTVQGLRPGNYQLQSIPSLDAITSPGKMAQFGMRMGFMSMGDAKQVNVDIQSNQEAFVQLDADPDAQSDGPTSQVTGTVLVNGQPGKDLVVMAYGALAMQTVQIDVLDPAGVMNAEAARWWQANIDRVPLSTAPFLSDCDQ